MTMRQKCNQTGMLGPRRYMSVLTYGDWACKPQGGKKSHELYGAKTEDWDRSGHTQATSHPASYSYKTIQDQEYQDINKRNGNKSSQTTMKPEKTGSDESLTHGQRQLGDPCRPGQVMFFYVFLWRRHLFFPSRLPQYVFLQKYELSGYNVRTS